MNKNIALITGVTGQDGSYLSEFLLAKGYEVHGTIRRSSVDYRERIAHLEGVPNFHLHYADMIIALAKEAAVTGEPIIRYMEYVFPHEGFADVTDQFMIGDTVLCAPVTEQGAITRTVVLPRGSWRYCDGTVYERGCTLTVPAPINVLPVFEKC